MLQHRFASAGRQQQEQHALRFPLNRRYLPTKGLLLPTRTPALHDYEGYDNTSCQLRPRPHPVFESGAISGAAVHEWDSPPDSYETQYHPTNQIAINASHTMIRVASQEAVIAPPDRASPRPFLLLGQRCHGRGLAVHWPSRAFWQL